MKLFISWSGGRSHRVARALYDWLPDVLQAVEPWLSSLDVRRGARWGDEVANRLQKSNVGILCLTPENRATPWILFEAGALSKQLETSLVCPYLFGLTSEELGPPLNQFNAASATREDTFRLVETINEALGPQALAGPRLATAFERCWPDLSERLNAIPTVPEETATILPATRRERQLLEEILGRLEKIEEHIRSNGNGNHPPLHK